MLWSQSWSCRFLEFEILTRDHAQVLGLPLLLSPEEVALLVARDAIQFIDMRGPPPAKSEAVVAAFR